MKIAVCRLDDIPRLGARRFRGDDGKTIAIFRTGGDEVFALRDQCPHKGGPLSQGIVFGESVSCPLHGWCISLKSGEAAAPDVGSVERFEVEVSDGIVRLDCRSAEGHGSPPDCNCRPPEGKCRPVEERGPIDAAPACAGATSSCTSVPHK